MRALFKAVAGAVAIIFAIPVVSWAVVEYQASGGPIGSAMLMWLNGSSVAVPASASNPVPMTPKASTLTYAASTSASVGTGSGQIFTVSYIVNVPGSQPAGNYTTTLTYICTPTF